MRLLWSYSTLCLRPTASTEEAPSLCWDATPYLPPGQGRCRSSAAPECSASLAERFISKRSCLIKKREMRSWSVTSTYFTTKMNFTMMN
ncbi:unnamed protein product [Linum tenue]|uniref:Secreted protein n=1 Tax=Linum tenue TaxID=586396 RepID=A0AAV0N6R7_9ROSI|nr:unnamed protein product [Linum tenue]